MPNKSWITSSNIDPPDNEFRDGAILSLKTNDNHMLVSASIVQDDEPDFVVVHRYEFISGQWKYKNSFLPSDPSPDSGLGFSFSMTDTDILIGSYLEDTIADDSGAVYSYDINHIFSNSFD